MLQYEIGHAFGARTVEIVGLADQALPGSQSTKPRPTTTTELPPARPARKPSVAQRCDAQTLRLRDLGHLAVDIEELRLAIVAGFLGSRPSTWWKFVCS